MSLFPTSTAPTMLSSLPSLSHRGFALDVQRNDGGYGFTISHHGLDLHASAPTHRSVHSAERAARQFVDDALSPFAPAPAPYVA